jgi:hypothetical protein
MELAQRATSPSARRLRHSAFSPGYHESQAIAYLLCARPSGTAVTMTVIALIKLTI